MNAPEIGDAGGAADGGQRSFVAIVKRLPRFSGEIALDAARSVNAALHRHLGDAGKRHAHRRKVADDENFRMPRQRQIVVDQNASGAVERHAERARQR